MEHPLVNHADRTLGLHQMRHGILGEHREPKARNELGQGVVDLGIVVVRATCQHDAVPAIVLDPAHGLLAHGLDILMEARVGLVSGVHGLINLGAGELGPAHTAATRLGVGHALHGEQLVQAALELDLVMVGHERVHELNVVLGDGVDVQAQGRGVAHHDGAVVAVSRRGVLLALPTHAGHPNEIRVLGDEVHHMAVGELGRIAHALARHGLDAALVGRLVGVVGEHHRKAQPREERMPERIVLVHVERTRNAHRAARGLVGA